MTMKYGAILLAAGKGNRYNDVKQDIEFHGKAVWRYPYDLLVSILGKENVVAVGKEVEGGETRTGSVLNGLKALSEDTDRVIIVEAARPMLTREQVLELLEDAHPSVSFVRPLVNTVIYRDGRYLNRSELYDLLTPQAFDYRLLLEAYQSGRFSDVTDDTRIMFEYHGVKPHFIETGSNLFKITYPGDLEIIEAIYRAQNNK
ncbi:MAG: 2-C-methyl-D-erythritol 4-phosphate cytidylyltransferase [Oscillospiraceae bacterium]|nr:2-C-methyl-D-erythritol 4-phosphate cytidylyltransferase [Oscillospiraceae bacterium]